MNFKLSTTNVIAFRDYLIENDYSKHVIPMYFRKVAVFLEIFSDFSKEFRKDTLELKEVIDEYVLNFPLTSQKELIKSALHTYYYFISGEKFIKRLSKDDYALNLSIELEVERFREYLKNVERLRDNTIISRCNTVRIFLYSSFPDKKFSPEKININLVQNYLVDTLSHIAKYEECC